MILKTTSILTVLTLALISCGESENASDEAGLAGYTTNQEEALEGYENMREDAEAHYADLMEIETSWRADRDEILADYKGDSPLEKEADLLEKAAKDDDAKGDLEDLRKREFSYRNEMNNEYLARFNKSWGIQQAINDLGNMLEGDAKRSFHRTADKTTEALSKMASDHNKAVSYLDKD